MVLGEIDGRPVEGIGEEDLEGQGLELGEVAAESAQ